MFSAARAATRLRGSHGTPLRESDGGHLGEVVARAATVPGESVARTVLELLQVAPADAVLELGCGSGRVLAAAAARLRRGFAAGIDPSDLMVRHARARNRRWIALGRVEVSAGRSDDLGRFADARFDKVYGTHVVYFWTEPARDLAEIRRVLRPGGRVVLGFFPSDDGTSGATRYPVERAVRLLGEAGFTEIRAERRTAGGHALAWLQGVPPVTASLDTARRDAFAERVLGILNGGALSLMISIGHRSGLFDVLGRAGFATSGQLAELSGLEERYVREWLGAMVAGGLVEYEPAGGRYRLPAEHAACLTRAARPNNLAATAQWVPLLASVEDEVLACFAHGGGVPYEAYHRFHEVMAEESDQTVVATLCETILPLVPGLVGRLEAGIDVADVGCGSGRALNRMAHTYPKSRFTGLDVSTDAIAAGRAEAEECALRNVRFEVRDAASLGPAAGYDLVTAFDSIHDQARPAAVLAAISRALRPDGVFLMQDIRGTSRVEEDARNPLGAFLYTVSCLHCMTVSLAAQGVGLGAMWGVETARRMLDEAGFAKLEVETLPHDVMNLYYVARKAG